MLEIRPLRSEDAPELFEMMKVFYASPAVISPMSEDILKADIEACFNPSLPLECELFICDGQTAGYAMTTRCYATEFGGMCAWLEDLYIKPEYRGMGISSRFFEHLECKCADCKLIKLEAEKENAHAVSVYKRRGFEVSEYFEMVKRLACPS